MISMSVRYLLWHRHFCGHISSMSNNDLAHVVSLYQYLLSTYGRNLSRYIIDDQTHSPPFIDSWTRICNLPSQAEEVGKGGRYPPEWNFHVINWSRVFMPYIKGISNINPRIPGLKALLPVSSFQRLLAGSHLDSCIISTLHGLAGLQSSTPRAHLC